MCKVMENMRNESLMEGIQKGMREGMQKGRQESMKAVAKRMLADETLPLEKIAEYTGLSLKEIEKLRASQSA